MKYYSILPCEYNFKIDIKAILTFFKEEIELILEKIDAAEKSIS